MPITPTNLIEKPAIEAKTFDQLFLKRFNIVSRTPLETSAMAVLVPVNSTTGETDPDGAVRVPMDNVQEVAATNPAVAQAMGALFIAVESYAKERGLI